MNDPLVELRLKFLDRCRGNLAILKQAAENRQTENRSPRPEDIVKTVHSIAGSGGIFGFSALSDRAAELESLLISDNDPDPSSVDKSLHDLISEMERVLAN